MCAHALRLLCPLLAAAALLGAASPAGAVTTLQPSNRGFDEGLSPWSSAVTDGLLSTASVSHLASGGDPGGAVRTHFVTGIGLLGLDTGTATLTSEPFTFSGPAPDTARVTLDRRAAIDALLAIGGGARWKVRLIDQTAAVTHTLADAPLAASDPGWTSHTIDVPLAALVSGHSYRLEIRSTFSTALSLLSGASIDYDDLTLEAFTDLRPQIGTAIALTVSADGFTAGARLDPNGLATDYWVEYGPTSSYGSQSATASAGGSAELDATAAVSGLQQGTTYHWRLVAQNAEGTTYGPDATATTLDPPSLSGFGASVSHDGFTAAAQIDPNGHATTYHLEYGPSAAYGNQSAPASAGAGQGPVAVAVPVSGLDASSAYHWRIVASSDQGTVHGPDQVATTDPAPAPEVPILGTASASPAADGFTVTGQVDPRGHATTYHLEYGPSAAYGSQSAPVSAGSGSGPVAVSIPLTGLSPGATYHWRLVAQSSEGTAAGPDQTVTTLDPPTLSGFAASVSHDGFAAAASVNPNGHATTWFVEYGTSTAYGSQTAPEAAGDGQGPVAVSVSVDGLSPATAYHWRLVASSDQGTVHGPDQIATTDAPPPPSVPVIGTGASAAPAADGFTVTGQIDPQGHATTYRIEYGPSPAYGNQTSPAPVGSGSGAVAVSAPVTGLDPGATYHWRIVAVSGEGTAYGPDTTVTTLDPPSLSGFSATSAADGFEATALIDPRGRPTTYHLEYGPTASYGHQSAQVALSGEGPVSVSVPVSGLSAGSTYHWRLLATSSQGTTSGPDQLATTLAPPVLGAATGTRGPQSISVQAGVDPRGHATTYHLEYGPSAAYGSRTASVSVGAGVGEVPVSVFVSGLDPDTTYHWRIVAESGQGATHGADATTTTLPPPPAPTPSTAPDAGADGTMVIKLSVDPGELDTDYLIEWGVGDDFDQATPTQSLLAGSGASTLVFTVAGLEPGVTSRWRPVAMSSAGTTRGPALASTTPPPPAPPSPQDPPPSPPQTPPAPMTPYGRCTIVGTAGADVLVGTRGRDIICGLGGRDRIRGLGGHDVLFGGAGDDVLVGGAGNDILRGGPGRDRLSGGAGNDRLLGGGGADRLFGGGGRDRIAGGAGADRLDGGPGNDQLSGGAGADRLRGGPGRDQLLGGPGRDRMAGGPGLDLLDGLRRWDTRVR